MLRSSIFSKACHASQLGLLQRHGRLASQAASPALMMSSQATFRCFSSSTPPVGQKDAVEGAKAASDSESIFASADYFKEAKDDQNVIAEAVESTS